MVAFSCTRISSTPPYSRPLPDVSPFEDTRAYVSPLRRVNASTSKGFWSAVAKATLPLTEEMPPPLFTWSSSTVLISFMATMTYVSPLRRVNASMPMGLLK